MTDQTQKGSGQVDRRISIGNDMRSNLAQFNMDNEVLSNQRQYNPNRLEATDDELKSGVDLPNPDSFLGASMSNFNNQNDLKVQKDD